MQDGSVVFCSEGQGQDRPMICWSEGQLMPGETRCRVTYTCALLGCLFSLLFCPSSSTGSPEDGVQVHVWFYYSVPTRSNEQQAFLICHTDGHTRVRKLKLR